MAADKTTTTLQFPSETLLGAAAFEDLEFIGAGPMTIGLSFDAPTELRQLVLAAVTTHLWGNNSVDNVLRRNRHLFENQPRTAEEIHLHKVLRAVRRDVLDVVKDVEKFGKGTVNWGLWAAEACLVRAKASFRSASFLVRHGYAFEASAICRLLLEQLAWAYAIRLRDDE